MNYDLSDVKILKISCSHYFTSYCAKQSQQKLYTNEWHSLFASHIFATLAVGILYDNYKILRWESIELVDVLTLCQKQIMVLMFRHRL